MRTYPDGWKLHRGQDLFAYPKAHWQDDRVLLDAAGEVVASQYIHMGSETIWGWRHWRSRSPYGRAKSRLQVTLAAAVAVNVVNILTRAPAWAEVVTVAACAISGWMVGRAFARHRTEKGKINGSNRGTEEDHPDPEAERTTSDASPGEGTGEAASEDTGLKLDVVEEDMPILAHRKAHVVNTGEGWAFQSLNGGSAWGVRGGTFKADEDAACMARENYMSSSSYLLGYSDLKPPTKHAAPGVDCECGFYAVPADKLEHFKYGGATLQVELSGTVIEHELGYRAEHQRVLAWTPPPCSGCGKIAKRAWFAPGKDTQVVWECGGHEYPEGKGTVILIVSVDDIAECLGVPVTT